MANQCRCGTQTIGGENRTVFCEGPLLDAVQRSNMFPCCKHFVDMSCIFSPTQTMADYDMFCHCRKNDGSVRFLQMFVEKHFNEPGSELEPWTPPDWKAQPSFLVKISDPEIKQFGSDVNTLWRQLGRRVKDEVKESPDQYSILYIPNPFIVSSSHCREYRYWDSFWIVRGLLQCGMHQTARGMIDNFLALVQQYGFVPGCGRIYCTGRSNPPLLIMMVKAYVEVTKDEKYALNSLPLLETEYETFISKHSIQVRGRTMYQYRDLSAGPRPEAYREDLRSVATIRDPLDREVLYTELKSAAESGMDFSSRWFVTADGSNQGSLADTKTSAIVPVELNAIVFRSGKILAEFNRKAGNTKKADEYQDRACGLVKAIRDNLWNDRAGIWLDYDVANNRPRNYFCCTNFAPLWARAYPLVDSDKVSKGVMQYIRTNNLDEQYGGVPHTLNKEAGQKWDYPNVFPPMMFLVIEGLDNLGTPASKAMSKRWAHRWVKSNYAAYKYENFMFEKYYCEEFGSSGGASPENTPVGYGWSNGVVIEFLCKYGKEINLADDLDEGCKCKSRKSPGARKGKHSYIITSEAYMEDQLSKKSCVCAAPSTATGASGATAATANKSTSTMSGPAQLDDSCSCGIAQAAKQQNQQQQGQAGQDGKCSCGPQQKTHQQSQAQMQRSQRQLQQGNQGAGADCACGAGARLQQQKSQQQSQAVGAPNAASCGICGAQKQQQSQAQTQRSRQQMQPGQPQEDCSCGAGVQSARYQQQLRSQHNPDCPCSGQQQTIPKGQAQGPGTIVFQGQHPPEDADCECSVDERQQQQMQQQQQQQDCMQQQKQLQQEHQSQQQQLQSDHQKEDCSSKPMPQDCSQHLKSQGQEQQQSEGACGCMDDEDQELQRQHDQLTGHYFPVVDKQADECSVDAQEDSSPQKTECDGCGREDCPEAPEEDCGCSGQDNQERAPVAECAQPKTQQYGAADDCSCSLGQGQGQAPPPTFICPHCGGITSEAQFNHVSSQSVGTNRPSLPLDDDCDCTKGAAGQQLRGLASMGLQSGHSKVVAGGSSGAQKPECGPCKALMASDYPPGHGPRPFYNKQFPLADPVSKIQDCPTVNEEKNKKRKCCNCDEKEE
ncbi:uncharacterized protein LOC128254718 [Drosophila gunungcola]|uniref:Trehalase n=1 Tax=Drosophila gunungcola TaxID=103775 RepID=A0A9Q0BNL4_9MUSC|nr:uncharacterized protein LOC128254718 [Drosophila gunungcola]KAI8038466.1 hypothetical protein M5D96_008364 [Drosophila gunungcola]